MKAAQQDFRVASQAQMKAASKPRRGQCRTPRDCPRVTLRLSSDDHIRLKEMADGMALATFIRAKALDEQLPSKKERSPVSVKDKQAISQILGLLGQSRIANNLNQLAYHANVGSLAMDDVTREQIEESHEQIVFIRQTLLAALGMPG